jgi:hypothetical protein
LPASLVTGTWMWSLTRLSFPVEQTAIDAGKVLTWTKGFSAKGAIGNDVVRLLQDALDKKHIHVRVSALVNDVSDRPVLSHPSLPSLPFSPLRPASPTSSCDNAPYPVFFLRNFPCARSHRPIDRRHPALPIIPKRPSAHRRNLRNGHQRRLHRQDPDDQEARRDEDCGG